MLETAPSYPLLGRDLCCHLKDVVPETEPLHRMRHTILRLVSRLMATSYCLVAVVDVVESALAPDSIPDHILVVVVP